LQREESEKGVKEEYKIQFAQRRRRKRGIQNTVRTEEKEKKRNTKYSSHRD
jgi:hypothetical protein